MSGAEDIEFEDEQEPTIKRGNAETEESADNVDWEALWEEFGFDTPDAVGSYIISSTQLVGALEATEQNIAGSPQSHIDQAEEDNILIEQQTKGADGEMHPRGYVQPGVQA